MNKENNIVKNKKILIIVLLVIMVIVVIPIGYSLFSDTKNEEQFIEIGKVQVTLEEDSEWEGNEDEFGIKKYTKDIKGVSVAEQDAYVRIRCIPVVQYFEQNGDSNEGKWITMPVSQSNIQVNVQNTTDWVQQGDYWYYTKILKGFEETGVLHLDWKILEIPSEFADKDIRTDVKVILEYSQVSNNMWKEIFQIDDLPSEVERVQ